MTGRIAYVAVLGLVLVGCTGGGGVSGPTVRPPVVAVDGTLRLASFDTCEHALGDLKRAMLPLVGPYGLGDGTAMAADSQAGPPQAPGPLSERSSGTAGEAAPQQQKSAAEHSSTNTHEAGVDEPDLVKTDGKRIVSVVDGTLRVLDTATRTQSASLVLPEPRGAERLLLSGDHALIVRGGHFAIEDRMMPPFDRPNGGPVDRPEPGPLAGRSELLLVDLAGPRPSVLATFDIDGRFVDARMVGPTVRVVTHSQPRLSFGFPTTDRDQDQAKRRNQDVVGNSRIDEWLPRFRLAQDGSVRTGRVDCSAVSRPEKFSATSMLTVLTFDLGAAKLGTGDPVTIVADGNVVYGTAGSLYVASSGYHAFGQGTKPVQESTELYKFDTSGTGKPRHVASGTVPGVLLNQYSMSEFTGNLRIATTSSGKNDTESTVYALAQRGAELSVIGSVGGLGKGERLYAVRFVGPVGYAVTFRQTDPLYTIDLRDPAAPRVTGELKITGYSAYLHPLGDGRVLGVGQEASEQGQVQGTQVSLFDVSDPAAPRRIAQYHLPGGSSEAEYDPHAFLYWPATRTLVLPVTSVTSRPGIEATAVVLRVGDGELAEAGQVRHPAPTGPDVYGPQTIRRALVVDDTLWTLSMTGAAANDLGTLGSRGWVAFNP